MTILRKNKEEIFIFKMEKAFITISTLHRNRKLKEKERNNKIESRNENLKTLKNTKSSCKRKFDAMEDMSCKRQLKNVIRRCNII